MEEKKLEEAKSKGRRSMQEYYNIMHKISNRKIWKRKRENDNK